MLDPTQFELMQKHVQALYVHDEQARLVAVSDWRSGIVPRFFLGRTQEGNLWRFRHDLPEVICEELSAICAREPAAGTGSPVHREDYSRILSQHCAISSVWNGPGYWCCKPSQMRDDTTLIGPDDSGLLTRGLTDWMPDVPYQQPMVAMITDGMVVAICASVRISGPAHEAGVEVLEPYRQRGYAAAVVSSWVHAVQETGALPMYSTSDQNLASQNVAAHLGLVRYGADFHIT